PTSSEWIPALHLISVDFPAPLSPTSAITSPARTSKSTPLRASTEPKLLNISRSSSVGGEDSFTPRFCNTTGRSERAPRRCCSYLQNLAYSPTQTWLFFRKPSLKRSV